MPRLTNIDSSALELRLNDVALRRGDLRLIEALSLTSTQSDLYYITGENGIGKTSLLLALAGLLRPDMGDISYISNGESLRASDCVSLVIQPDGVSRGLTAKEDLEFYLSLSGNKELSHSLLDKVGLTAAQNVKVEGLSLGQRKRLNLAKTIGAHRPVWLLDEPFSALDADGRNLVADTISAHLSQGGICFIATHHPVPISGFKAKTIHLSAAPSSEAAA
jgi:heme exporter protein A